MELLETLRSDIKATLLGEYNCVVEKIKHYEEFLKKERELRDGLQKILKIIKNDNELNVNKVLQEYLEEKIMLCDSMIRDFEQFRDDEIEERERYEHEWPQLFISVKKKN